MLAQIHHHIPGGLRVYGMAVQGRRRDFVRTRDGGLGLNIDISINGQHITFTARIADAVAAVAALRDAVQSFLAGGSGEATIDGITATVRAGMIEVFADRIAGFTLCSPDRRYLYWFGQVLGQITGHIPSRRGGCPQEAEIFARTICPRRRRCPLKLVENRDILLARLLAEEIMRDDRDVLRARSLAEYRDTLRARSLAEHHGTLH
jgi:hypothetical protein